MIKTNIQKERVNAKAACRPALLVPPSSGLATTAWFHSGTFSLIHLNNHTVISLNHLHNNKTVHEPQFKSAGITSTSSCQTNQESVIALIALIS